MRPPAARYIASGGYAYEMKDIVADERCAPSADGHLKTGSARFGPNAYIRSIELNVRCRHIAEIGFVDLTGRQSTFSVTQCDEESS